MSEPERADKQQLRAARLADVVFYLHSAFSLFAVIGGFFILLSPWVMVAHIPTVLWSSWVHLANQTCPLTPLEQYYRRKAGQPVFQGGWLTHYLEPMIHPRSFPKRMNLIIGVAILVWNLVVYLLVSKVLA